MHRGVVVVAVLAGQEEVLVEVDLAAVRVVPVAVVVHPVAELGEALVDARVVVVAVVAVVAGGEAVAVAVLVDRSVAVVVDAVAGVECEGVHRRVVVVAVHGRGRDPGSVPAAHPVGQADRRPDAVRGVDERVHSRRGNCPAEFPVAAQGAAADSGNPKIFRMLRDEGDEARDDAVDEGRALVVLVGQDDHRERRAGAPPALVGTAGSGLGRQLLHGHEEGPFRAAAVAALHDVLLEDLLGPRHGRRDGASVQERLVRRHDAEVVVEPPRDQLGEEVVCVRRELLLLLAHGAGVVDDDEDVEVAARAGAAADAVAVRVDAVVDDEVAVVVLVVAGLGSARKISGIRVVAVARAGGPAVAVRVREALVHRAVAVVVGVVAALVRVGADRGVGVVAVAVAGRHAVAVLVDVLVHLAVAVLVDAVLADLVRPRVDGRVLVVAVAGLLHVPFGRRAGQLRAVDVAPAVPVLVGVVRALRLVLVGVLVDLAVAVVVLAVAELGVTGEDGGVGVVAVEQVVDSVVVAVGAGFGAGGQRQGGEREGGESGGGARRE
jgi:hypothetical protein